MSLLGHAALVESDEERLRALEAFSEHLAPGRWKHVRHPNRQELKATQVLSVTIDGASAKARSGPPTDDNEDMAHEVWAGVVPLQLQALDPVPDPQLTTGIELPQHVSDWAAARAGPPGKPQRVKVKSQGG